MIAEDKWPHEDIRRNFKRLVFQQNVKKALP